MWEFFNRIGVHMKKGKLLRNAFVIALIAWIVMLVKQQINIKEYQDEINV